VRQEQRHSRCVGPAGEVGRHLTRTGAEDSRLVPRYRRGARKGLLLPGEACDVIVAWTAGRRLSGHLPAQPVRAAPVSPERAEGSLLHCQGIPIRNTLAVRGHRRGSPSSLVPWPTQGRGAALWPPSRRGDSLCRVPNIQPSRAVHGAVPTRIRLRQHLLAGCSPVRRMRSQASY